MPTLKLREEVITAFREAVKAVANAQTVLNEDKVYHMGTNRQDEVDQKLDEAVNAFISNILPDCIDYVEQQVHIRLKVADIALTNSMEPDDLLQWVNKNF